MDPVREAIDELHSLQEVVDNREPFTGTCRYYVGIYDVFREVLSSDLEEEDSKEQI